MKSYKIVALIATGVAGVLFSCSETPKSRATEPTVKTPNGDSSIARGKYLVSILGCNDCHSPKIIGPQGPQPNEDLLLSGHPANEPIGLVDTSEIKSWTLFNFHNTAVVGPWGVSYAANLTSDETGIGSWTEEQFLVAMKKGKYKGIESNRPLLPPMPWFNYANATDEDLKAIFQFLKTTKPVHNVVPLPQPLTQLAKR